MSGNGVEGAAVPCIDRRFRLQWEAAQNSFVLLYPEGMVKLNGSAGEIMKRCDGKATVEQITGDLEKSFAVTGLNGDVVAFVTMALDKNWLTLKP